MFPYINIFGKNIPSYSLCVILGVISGIMVILFLSKKDKEMTICYYVFALLGALVGSKALYLLINIPQIVNDFSSMKVLNVIRKYLSGGFVFYGGLYGAIFGTWLCGKIFKESIHGYINIVLPSLILFHTFGRVGCFMVGCCYGVPSSFGYVFTSSEIAPNGIRLFPTQLLEAGWEVLLFIVFLFLMRKDVFFLNNRVYRNSIYYNPRKNISLYFVLYAPFRFILEFFRGDGERGFFLNLSTSQWISIITMIVGVLFLFDIPYRHVTLEEQKRVPVRFCKDDPSCKIWYVVTVREEDRRIGPLFFSFDKKKIYNFWSDYWNLSEKEREIFKKENPVMASLKDESVKDPYQDDKD